MRQRLVYHQCPRFQMRPDSPESYNLVLVIPVAAQLQTNQVG